MLFDKAAKALLESTTRIARAVAATASKYSSRILILVAWKHLENTQTNNPIIVINKKMSEGGQNPKLLRVTTKCVV